MILRHVALTCSSEENSDRFYKDLLGLEKLEPKILPSSLSRAIFNIDNELRMINYTGKAVHFEIFIAKDSKRSANPIAHVAIEIDDQEAFLKKCAEVDVNVSQIPRGNRTLIFIRDFDGNLFEIKHKQSNA
jgi:catechol 2,3-dioxygenase-like lactoylglutathione lyase family enzyme